MKTQSTFSNWDFINVWAIIDGFSYPYLLWGEPPLLDSDDDGVLDVEDLCPFEDSGGVDADLNGCVDTVAGLQDVIISASVSGEIANQTNASLTSKMDNVVSNVDRENYATAINVLQAFINEVEAQSGKKIDPETAEMLIEYANNLIAELYTEE